jgi:uncharacterized lipoprotein YmbA
MRRINVITIRRLIARPRFVLLAAGAILLSGLLSGCIGSHSAAPAYHLLTARAQTKIATLDTSIGVGPVRIAPFLARADITTHAGGGAMHFSSTERWGEPLDQGIQRVLLQNIAVLSGAETRNFPWRQSAIPRYAARIDIADLDRLGDGKAILEVNWMIEDLTNSRVIKTQQERFSVAVNGSDTDALAMAYSDLFSQLAEHIVQATANP